MITRRSFIAIGGGLAASLFTAGHSRLPSSEPTSPRGPTADLINAPLGYEDPLVTGNYSAPITGLHPDKFIADKVAVTTAKITAPPHPDVIASATQKRTIKSLLARLQRLQSYVGHGNFNLIGWDQSLKIARNHEKVGAFTGAELDLIEEIFSTNAQELGFYGDKVVTSLSATIPQKNVLKIPGTGHFLFKGPATETYLKIRRDMGDSVLLTSGIRSVMKQVYLFLAKVESVDGNLSLASYSLAPPGHSYHAIGDFDVGKKGFGSRNFSADFAETDEFKRLIDLGYLDIRYTQKNPFGVRYEPWHIKIV
jgi:zinc D-Ala-D-Ala carboxypeptidase